MGVSHTTALLGRSTINSYYIHTTAFCTLAGYVERAPSFHEEPVVTWNCEWREPSLAEQILAKILAKILNIFRKQQIQYPLLTTTIIIHSSIIAHLWRALGLISSGERAREPERFQGNV